jgi:hypothetical protein
MHPLQAIQVVVVVSLPPGCIAAYLIVRGYVDFLLLQIAVVVCDS